MKKNCHGVRRIQCCSGVGAHQEDLLTQMMRMRLGTAQIPVEFWRENEDELVQPHERRCVPTNDEVFEAFLRRDELEEVLRTSDNFDARRDAQRELALLGD
ncbi:hypothetical protein IT397_01870 [Candidatus Nomurabacteria bacterium]|nr:hypothetical protein [Candidatus Nomurabacteria bacterium]